MMSNKKPTYEELERQLADAQAIITTLRKGEVDAILSERNVALLRVKEAEDALREQAQILQQVHDIVICTDLDGYILSWNRGAERVYGYSAEEALGRHISFMCEDEARKDLFHQQVIKPLLEKRSDEAEIEVLTKTGEERCIHLSLSPIRGSDGNVSMMCVYGIDVTERKKLDQAKDDFIGLVSHELRSPLTVITGAVNTVLTEGARLSPQETRQLLQDAALETESLSHLVANLLELSRVQADRLFLHTEPISVMNLVQNTVERVGYQSSIHQFLVDLPKELPLVYADPLRLERVLHNLLENAVKYSPRGGDIRVSVKPEEEYLVFCISDQGIGIPLLDQAKLFRPFQRLEDSSLDGAKGAGLGLLVCRRLVEAHGGQIWVESEPGRGSTFFFTLSLNRS